MLCSIRRAQFAALLTLIALLTLPLLAHAVPYNHINADGTWGVGEWDVSSERRCVNTTTPYGPTDGNVQSILVTWDHDSLYVGVEGNTWSNAELVYIDSDGLTSGSITAPLYDFYKGFSTPGWNPDFVFGCYDMQYGSVVGGNPQLRTINGVGLTSGYLGGRFAVKDKASDGGHGTGLVEIAIPWAHLGLHAGGHIRVAAGTGYVKVKTPQVRPDSGLGGESGDELCGTDQVGGTDGLAGTLDTPVDIAYDLNGDGIPDNSVDTTPPIVLSAASDSPAPNYSGSHNTALVYFSEVVQKTTSETAGNYQLDGAVTPISAVRGNPDSTTVLLTFGSPIAPGGVHVIRATNVKDRNNNTIANNGTTNIAQFCIERITFRVNMSLHLRTDSPPDSVVIIGNTLPLDFSSVCKIKLYDDGTHGDFAAGDSIYSKTLDFCRSGANNAPPTDSTQLEYEINHRCTEYEGVHHIYQMKCSKGLDTLNTYWQNIAPADFTTHPIDVIFRCDASLNPGQGLWINGSASPLNFNVPSITSVLDNGVAPDSATGDRRYTRRLRFPTGTSKNVDYKFLSDSLLVFTYECGNNRNVFLNDAAYDTVGGANGPLIISPASILGQNCVATAVGAGPLRGLFLRQNRPNPFSAGTQIRFSAPYGLRGDLSLYSAAGVRVRTLWEGRFQAGENVAQWDGRDQAGRRLPSGTYFYRLRAGSASLENRMLLLH